MEENKTKIKQLKPNVQQVETTGTIISMDPVVDGAGWSRCDAILKDDSGQIKFVLWDDEIPQVNTGDTIKISNGYVKDFKGTLQLQVGRIGKIEVTKKAELHPSEALKQNEFDAARYHLKQLSLIFDDLEKTKQ